MAANVLAPNAPNQSTQLPGFQRVSKLVYMCRPDRKLSDSVDSSSPKLILVGGWMGAREPHLAKYTTKLQNMFPDSPIILVRSFEYHFMGNPFAAGASLRKDIEPVAPLIRSLMEDVADGRGQRPKMLVHGFSNGGSTMLRFLYDSYKASAKPGDTGELPAHVTIFDSAPGRMQWGRSVYAFTVGVAKSNFLVRLPMTVFAHFFCLVYWIISRTWDRPGYLEQTWLTHNDKSKNTSEVRRTYIYSYEDRLVDPKDVEEHAMIATERGYKNKLEQFQGTAHVAHMRSDEERYWKIVREAWEDQSL